MGLFNFKKKEETSLAPPQVPSSISPPSTPGETTSVKQQESPSGVFSPSSQYIQQGSLTKAPVSSSAKESSFDVPDFSDEDLNFDIGLEDFAPEKPADKVPDKALLQIPETMPAQTGLTQNFLQIPPTFVSPASQEFVPPRLDSVNSVNSANSTNYYNSSSENSDTLTSKASSLTSIASSLNDEHTDDELPKFDIPAFSKYPDEKMFIPEKPKKYLEKMQERQEGQEKQNKQDKQERKPAVSKMSPEITDKRLKDVFSDEMAQKMEVFIEKENYKQLMTIEERLLQDLRENLQKSNNALLMVKIYDESYSMLSRTLIDMQRKLLALDQKIFEKGDA